VTALNRLFVRKLTSIGAVVDGDDPEARIMLVKRRVTNTERDRLVGEGKALPDGSFPIVTVKDLSNAVQAFGRASSKAAAKRHIIAQAERLGRVDLLPDKWMKSTDSAANKGQAMDFAKLGVTDDAREAIEAEFAKLQTKIDELTEPDVDILKGISDDAKAEFEKQAAAIAKMESDATAQAAELVKERDARLTAEFTKQAEGYTGVLGDADQAGPHLKDLAKADEAYKWLIEKLDAVSAIVATSDLFKELGVNDEADPKSQIEALAFEKRKDNPDLTQAQAKVLVRKERPDLKAAERQDA